MWCNGRLAFASIRPAQLSAPNQKARKDENRKKAPDESQSEPRTTICRACQNQKTYQTQRCNLRSIDPWDWPSWPWRRRHHRTLFQSISGADCTSGTDRSSHRADPYRSDQTSCIICGPVVADSDLWELLDHSACSNFCSAKDVACTRVIKRPKPQGGLAATR